jgi:hypothetical protein
LCGKDDLEVCDDGWDNDCDELIDALDPDCGCDSEDEICDDEVDNNCDGLVDEDCDDEVCVSTEICDGEDNDNDGEIDEGFDRDNDGYTICGGDCNDLNPDVNPDLGGCP